MEFGIIVLGTFVVHFAPLIVSLFAPDPGPKLFALGWTVLAVLLSVEDYWWLVPWLIGVASAGWAVWQTRRPSRAS